MKVGNRAAQVDLGGLPAAEAGRGRRRDAHAVFDGLQRRSLKRTSVTENKTKGTKLVKISPEPHDQVEPAEATYAVTQKGQKLAKRKRKCIEDEMPSTAISYARDHSLDNEEESPNKIRRLSESGDGLCSDEGEDMEIQEGDEEYDEDTVEEDSFFCAEDGKNRESFGKHQATDKCESRTSGKMDEHELGKNLRSRITCTEVQGRKGSSQYPTQYGFGNIVEPQKNCNQTLAPRSSIRDYREAPAERRDTATLNKAYYLKSNISPQSAAFASSRYQRTNVPVTKPSVGTLEKGGPSKLLWLCLVLLSLSLLCFLIYWFRLDSYLHLGAGVLRRQNSTIVKFDDQFINLKSHFPNQREELWSRSKIYLTKHLQTEQSAEPASLILTAGHRAEKTLRCLATRIADTLSTALNTTVLQIDGAGKASADSDMVKLDIDEKLRKAFEGNKGTAVIHQFEELPPGSTLIFYKYCDHENAAFKNAFLIFTVILPLEELEAKLHLNEVEEMVQDHIKDRFLSQTSPSTFDTMDVDKFGGLWSRIAHLVLPVVPEEDITQNGCQS